MYIYIYGSYIGLPLSTTHCQVDIYRSRYIDLDIDIDR